MDWEETLGDQKPKWDSQFDGLDRAQVDGSACVNVGKVSLVYKASTG